jgi:ectoine hydroxylase
MNSPCTDNGSSSEFLVIDRHEKAEFDSSGYLCRQQLVAESDLSVLRAAVDRLIEKSRSISQSDGVFDLETGHTADNPRLRRVAFLDDLDSVFWEFAADSVVTDLARDLFGRDITFRESLINFKWSGGGSEVKWHQDIPFYPHTNLSLAQFLVFLDDIGAEQGPLQVLPGSHLGKIYDHYDSHGNWLGYIPGQVAKQIPLDQAVEVTGPAGTVSVHHCATIHGSRPNLSPKPRPVLILGYNAEDARPYTAAAYPSSHHGQVVRGEPAQYARHDNLKLRLPPDWSGGYTSIFSHQEIQESNIK